MTQANGTSADLYKGDVLHLIKGRDDGKIIQEIKRDIQLNEPVGKLLLYLLMELTMLSCAILCVQKH